MFAFQMLWIFLNIFHFTVIFCGKLENRQEIKENFTRLDVEEASGGTSEIDQALFQTFIENWEETDDDFLNVTDYSDNLHDNEQNSDTLNFNDSSSAFTDESLLGTTEKFEFAPRNLTYNISHDDILSRWLQEEEEGGMRSLDFEDYDSEIPNDSNEKLETFTTEEKFDTTINFQNNGQILNLTVVKVSETTTVSNRQSGNLNDKTESKILRQYFGVVRNGDGVKCLSLNFTFDVFLKGVHVDLNPIADVDGNCDSSNNIIKFKWLKADNHSFNAIANFKIECSDKICFVNGINVEVEDTKNGETFSAMKKKLHLFESKPGEVYKNATLMHLEMNQNIRISLSNVTFYIEKHLNSNELTLAQGGRFGDYYVETIASVVGFVVLISFTIYIIYILRKIKKSKGDFVPSST